MIRPRGRRFGLVRGESQLLISVIIPAYNASTTIRAALDSVLAQTRSADEILVMDDGSTDQTLQILESYEQRVHVFRQENRGVAAARNALCARASGDLIAFLDADDIWHPDYLAVQANRFTEYPQAAAFFTGQMVFSGYGGYTWDGCETANTWTREMIGPVAFFARLCKTGKYGSAFCCVPKEIITHAGPQPFSSTLASAEDFYLFASICLLNRNVIYTPTPLVAYRRTPGSLSANRIKIFAEVVEAFRLLERRFHEEARPGLVNEFDLRFASARRTYCRCLMLAGRIPEAREQLLLSLENSHNPESLTKSLAMLLLTYLPSLVQPRWAIHT